MTTVMLEWEDVLAKFQNLVKYAASTAYREKSRVDNAVSPSDLYQIGLLKLYECHQKYAHLPMEEFKAVFTTTLFRSVRRGAKNSDNLDLEEALVGEEGHEDDYVDQLSFKEGLEQLKSSLNSPIAVAILQELIEPSPRTLWEVWADGARKRQLKINQSKNVNLSKNTEVKMKHIRNALQISQKQFDNGIAEIRSLASFAFVL